MAVHLPSSVDPGRPTSRRRRELMYGALAGQLQTIARIHSARVAEVRIEHKPGSPPGWSSGGHIWLNAAELPDPMTVDGLLVWIGVLMHEMGHCQWSPEIDTFAPSLRQVYNMVEDQRQEHLVAERLPGVVDAFTLAITNLIVKRDSLGASASRDPKWQLWGLIAGRRYLPPELRAAVRRTSAGFKGEGWVKKLDALIAEYKALADPGFSDRAEAERILDTILKMMGSAPPMHIGCRAEGSSDPSIGGVAADPSDDADSIDGDDGDKSSEGAGTPDEGTPGEGDPSGASDDGADDDGQEADDGQGSEAGTGHKDGTEPTPQPTLEDVAKDAAKKAQEPLRQQAQIILRRVRDEIGHADIDVGHTVLMPPSADARLVERRLLAQLKPLLEAADAGLESMTHQGRLRPERLAAGYRPDYSFDKWRLDQHDTVSAEIVVAVDVSGSMGGHMTDLSEAIWVMKQVTSKTASKLTVLLWDTQVTEFRPKPGRQVELLSSRGGTDVWPVVTVATDVFAASQSKRKWLIVMTDGSSAHNEEKVKNGFQALEASGVVVTGLTYGGAARMEEWGISHRRSIANLSQIPELIGGMLRDVYRRVVA